METLELRQRLAVAATSLRVCLEQHRAAGIQVLPARAPAPQTTEVESRPEKVLAAPRTGEHAGPPDQVLAARAPAPATDRRQTRGSLVPPARAAVPAPAPAASAPEATAGGDATGSAADLGQLRELLGDCRRCGLWQGRTHIVYGVGAADADVMFVGEGPGRDEDLQGEPFVGRAGQLLTDIITKGMRLRREDVYIANVVKCRPPQNRDPEPEEVASCEPFLSRQIELVKPRVIIALGKFAAQTLTRSTAPISRLRGQWRDYRGIRLMPTFHPAYLLRNPADKRLVWEDIKSVLRELDAGGAR